MSPGAFLAGRGIWSKKEGIRWTFGEIKGGSTRATRTVLGSQGPGSRQASWRAMQIPPLSRRQDRMEAQSQRLQGTMLVAAITRAAARGSGSRRRTKGRQVRI